VDVKKVVQVSFGVCVSLGDMMPNYGTIVKLIYVLENLWIDYRAGWKKAHEV
jgi:hypothetical protein